MTLETWLRRHVKVGEAPGFGVFFFGLGADGAHSGCPKYRVCKCQGEQNLFRDKKKASSMPGITNIYDELGRLPVAVVDAAGDTGIYAYDAVGNLLAIERQSSSVVSIVEFTPKSASVGTSVTIHGTGFSETPGENAVTFNGVPATVISASATRIVTIVPSGAASGPITSTRRSVRPRAPPPSRHRGSGSTGHLAAFSPTTGVPLVPTVTITGTHFKRYSRQQ